MKTIPEELLSGSFTSLYNGLAKTDVNLWTSAQLRHLLLLRFNLKPRSGATKKDLLAELMRNAYNADYMASMKRLYEGNGKELKTTG